MFESVIKEIKSIIKTDNIVIACSTGADSMCLLSLLQLALNHDQINVVHINHNVRTSSIDEQSFITSYCKSNNLNLYVANYTFEPQNFENTARMRRYAYFKEVASKTNSKYILTAHNANDNLETIIMRLLKKSSLKGYGGIEYISTIEGYTYFRPLLKQSKEDIYKYLQINKIPYYEDETNQEDIHLRNRIRHHIIPHLQEENPKLFEGITYYANTIFQASKIINDLTNNFINDFTEEIDHDIIIDLNKFNKLDDYLQNEVLFTLLKKYQLSIMHIEEIKKIIKGKTKVVTKFNEDFKIIKEYQKIIFTTKEINQKEFFLTINNEGIYLVDDEVKLEITGLKVKFIKKDQTMWYNIPGFPVVIRTKQSGDTIKRTNKGSIEYTQKINDVLKNQKIPTLKRKHLYVLEYQKEILFLLGLKLS